MQKFVVNVEYVGYRIDKYLIEQKINMLYSRSMIEKLLLSENILVNSKLCKRKSHKLKYGDTIDIIRESVDLQRENYPQKENIELNIVYEDEYLAIINKPAGLIVHPCPNNDRGTIVNALLFHFDSLSINDLKRPGIVHRLDKDTTGLLIVTKDNNTHSKMSQLFMQRKVEKYYLCVVLGVPNPLNGTIDLPIGRHKTQRMKMAICEDGKRAISHYRTLIDFEFYSFLEVKIETGRTHQIRVHLNAINTPIVGDAVYSTNQRIFEKCPFYKQNDLKKYIKNNDFNLMLHATRLKFVHPFTNDYLDVSVGPPDSINIFLDFLKSSFEYCYINQNNNQ